MKKEGFSMWTFSKRGFLTLIALIWIAILGVISPAWFSIGVVLVTGTSKGIDVSVIIRYFRKLKKGLSFVPIILFGVCSFCTIAFTVGIVEYFTEIAKCFTYAISVYWQNDF